MEVLSARGFGDSFGAASNDAISNGYGGSAYSEQVRRLLAQRERLLAEISSEERHEAAEIAQGKARIVASEVEETKHREAAAEARAKHQLAEEHLSSAEAGNLNSAWTFWVAKEGYGTSRAMLLEETNLCREKLASSRNARADKVVAKAVSERQRLDECISAIRTRSQENQALEANQQMAQAHLKALEAMAVSSAAQVKTRENALHNMLRHLEDQESISADIHVRYEVIEAQLEAASEEMRHHEALSSSTSSLTLKEYEEMSQECKSFKLEVEKLKKDNKIAQDMLNSDQRLSGLDDGLRATVDQLRGACEAAIRTSHDLALKTPLLESEIARLSTEVLSENSLHSELEVDMRVPALTNQLASEKSSAVAVASLESEEQALMSELVEREADCHRLQVEAAERDKQFITMKQTLEDQIASLRSEEMMEEEAALNVVRRASKERPLASNFSLPAVPLPATRATSALGVSAPPTRLQDPGCGAQAPPRRGLRRELSMDSSRQIEDSGGSLASRPTSLMNSRSQPTLVSGQHQRPPSPFEQQRINEAYTRMTSAHRPHWQELEPGWHPSASVSQRPANAFPREGLESIAFGGNTSIGSSWNAGNVSSADTSRLFHTHNASGSFESNLFHTPPIGYDQRTSPTATTLRRSASTRGNMFGDTVDHQADTMMDASSWNRGRPPLRRARTPPARPPSAAQQAFFGNAPRSHGVYALGESGGPDSNLTQQLDSALQQRSTLQARLADLKGVIGASLQSLDEEEAADAHAWGGARAAAIAAREVALRDRRSY